MEFGGAEDVQQGLHLPCCERQKAKQVSEAASATRIPEAPRSTNGFHRDCKSRWEIGPLPQLSMKKHFHCQRPPQRYQHPRSTVQRLTQTEACFRSSSSFLPLALLYNGRRSFLSMHCHEHIPHDDLMWCQLKAKIHDVRFLV